MTIARIPWDDRESDLQIAARRAACILPAVIIGYSALVDPLINLDSSPRVYFGGIQIGAVLKSNIAARILVPALFLISVVLALIARPRYPRSLNLVTAPAAAFLLLALASSLWAFNPRYTATLALYQILLCGSLFLAVGVSADPDRVMRNLFWLFAVVVLLNVLFMVARLPGPVGNQGIYPYKNTLGSAAGCAFILAAFQIFRGSTGLRIAAALTFAGAGFLLAISQSKTGLGMALAAPVIALSWWGISRFLHLNLIITAFVISIMAVAVFVTVSRIFEFDLSDLTMLVLGDDTFTGRTYVWSFVRSHIEDDLLLGKGYRGFWDIGPESPKYHSEIEFIRITGSSHNGFLDTLLDLGVIGLALQGIFILAVISACGRLSRDSGSDPGVLLAIMVFVIGRNMMESVILWSTFFDNLLFVLVGFLTCLNWRPSGRYPQPAEMSRFPPDRVSWR